ncbi:MAG: SMI1/KNR4 family protein [Holophagales bacterium]|jgi:hypothetical protein|nr:SMI1/KNR4 family protein [Holophagales bacterium]
MTSQPFWSAASPNPAAGASTIAAAESRLALALPAAYVEVMRQQDGGDAPRRNDYRDPQTGVVWRLVFGDGVLPLDQLVTLDQLWEEIDFGGDEKSSWIEVLGDLARIVPFARLGFRTHTCFDYTVCGPAGEPSVIELVLDGPEVRRRVTDFQTLLNGLFEAGETDLDGAEPPRVELARTDEELRQSALLAAAEAGDAGKMLELAHQLLYSTLGRPGSGLPPEGGPAERTMALGWYERAARGGNAKAAMELAELYEMGRGFERDLAKAMAWGRHAAGLGDRWAMLFLSQNLEEGALGPADPMLAWAWSTVALRERYDDADFDEKTLLTLHRNAATLGASLSPEQRGQAEALVRLCDEGPPHRLPDEID